VVVNGKPQRGGPNIAQGNALGVCETTKTKPQRGGTKRFPGQRPGRCCPPFTAGGRSLSFRPRLARAPTFITCQQEPSNPSLTQCQKSSLPIALSMLGRRFAAAVPWRLQYCCWQVVPQ
jgi:hypothetical protein